MPETVVKHKGHLSFRAKVELWRAVGSILAEELSCDDPDGGLERDDIMMFFEQINPGEACFYDLYLRVEAMAYPSRLDDIKDRAIRARHRIESAYPDKRIGLWIKLSEGHWTESAGFSDLRDKASTVRG